jgi:hypothetical protein
MIEKIPLLLRLSKYEVPFFSSLLVKPLGGITPSIVFKRRFA